MELKKEKVEYEHLGTICTKCKRHITEEHILKIFKLGFILGFLPFTGMIL